MLIRDVMTTNVVSVPSTTSLADARRIMDAHRVRRLPVVDRGKLLGIVTRDAVDKAGPSQLTTFSIHEISYLINKITVSKVMVKDVVTVSPDATVEEAVALAQQKGVGSLLVVEQGKMAGIVTTNDFFYKLLNPILGIGEPGSRIAVRNCVLTGDMAKILSIADKQKAGVTSLYTTKLPDGDGCDCTMHLSIPDPSGLIAELRKAGFTVEERAR